MDRAPTPRAQLGRELKNLFASVRNGHYGYVSRGAVNWAAFPFEELGDAVSINFDDSPLEQNHGDIVTSIEIFQRMPSPTTGDKSVLPRDIDDAGLDSMFEDLRAVLRDIRKVKRLNEPMESLVLEVFEGRVAEAHDVEGKGIQGLVASVTFRF